MMTVQTFFANNAILLVKLVMEGAMEVKAINVFCAIKQINLEI